MAELGTDMIGTLRVRRVLTVGAVAAAALVCAAGLVGAFAGTAVLPCATCHAMEAFATSAADAAHASVTCRSCHAGGSIGGSLDLGTRVAFRMLPAAIAGADGPTGSTTPVVRDGCLECHDQILVLATGGSGIAIDHAACAASGACTGCHGGTAHPQAVRWPRLYSMEACVACHQEAGIDHDCDACHTGKSEHDRLAVGSWQVTHGANWRETHGMGSLQYCGTCHPDTYCVDCHGIPLPHAENWGSQHGIAAVEDRDGCETCHPGETLCDSCHGMDMPHPDSFLQSHSSLADTVDDERCSTCHLVDDCIECHENHVHPGGPNMPEPAAGVSGGDA